MNASTLSEAMCVNVAMDLCYMKTNMTAKKVKSGGMLKQHTWKGYRTGSRVVSRVKPF